MERLRQLTSTLLDPQNSACSLRPEVVEITGILEESSEMQSLSEFETIDANETRTSNGLAVSPTMAAMCAADFVRTIKFMRGVHAAIDDVRKQFPDRPARVLYAGCGPYATLAVPVMTQFCPPDVTFTLLDLHPKSIASVRSIVGTLGLDEFRV